MAKDFFIPQMAIPFIGDVAAGCAEKAFEILLVI